jgi:hypothetical protein
VILIITAKRAAALDRDDWDNKSNRAPLDRLMGQATVPASLKVYFPT